MTGGASSKQRHAAIGATQIFAIVIFITAHEDEGMRAQALRDGAEAVLIKPFSEEALLNAIHAALSRNDFESKQMTRRPASS